jgi:hypothetical protein
VSKKLLSYMNSVRQTFDRDDKTCTWMVAALSFVSTQPPFLKSLHSDRDVLDMKAASFHLWSRQLYWSD